MYIAFTGFLTALLHRLQVFTSNHVGVTGRGKHRAGGDGLSVVPSHPQFRSSFFWFPSMLSHALLRPGHMEVWVQCQCVDSMNAVVRVCGPRRNEGRDASKGSGLSF